MLLDIRLSFETDSPKFWKREMANAYTKTFIKN